jgi:shikimate kinase
MLFMLIGLRGCGKTTIAPLLAAKVGCGWSDLDALVAARLGCTGVRDAWDKHGVQAFREAETRCLADVLHRHAPAGKNAPEARAGHVSHVLALGGGTPTAPGAAAMMQEARTNHRAIALYLRARPETLQARLRAASGDAIVDRPSLTGEDPVAEVPRVFMQRDPLYMTLADVVVQVDELPVEETMLEIQSELVRQGRVTNLA